MHDVLLVHVRQRCHELHCPSEHTLASEGRVELRLILIADSSVPPSAYVVRMQSAAPDFWRWYAHKYSITFGWESDEGCAPDIGLGLGLGSGGSDERIRTWQRARARACRRQHGAMR